MSTKIIALDIGTNAVRAFEMQANFRSSQPLAYYQEEVRVKEDQSILEAQVEALARLIELHQLKADTMCCSVPRHMVASLTISLPFIQKKQIEMTMNTQIDDLLPIDVEDVFYDYQIISQTDKNQIPAESKLLIAYVKRDEFEELIKLLQNHHIDPKLMTLGIFAYQSMLNQQYENAQAILNFGTSGAEWAIFDEGKLQQFYSIDNGSQEIDIALAEAFRVPVKQAEEGKLLEAQLKEEPEIYFNEQQERREELIRESILNAIHPLEQALSRSLAAFEKNHNRTIDILYLTGGGSQLKGFKEYLARKLMIHVVALEVPSAYTKVIPHAFSEASQAYAMALLVAKNQGSKLLQFRKGVFAYTGDFGFLKGRMIGVGLAVVSMLFLLAKEYQVKHEMIEAEIADIQKQVAQMSKNLLNEEDASADRILSVVTAEQKESKKIPEYSAFYTLGELSQNIGPEIVVDIDKIDINVTRGKLELQGKTKSISEVTQIVESIKKTQCFKNQVKKEQANKGADDRTNFRLTASSSCE